VIAIAAVVGILTGGPRQDRWAGQRTAPDPIANEQSPNNDRLDPQHDNTTDAYVWRRR
jgi:hypothetical protein